MLLSVDFLQNPPGTFWQAMTSYGLNSVSDLKFPVINTLLRTHFHRIHLSIS